MLITSLRIWLRDAPAAEYADRQLRRTAVDGSDAIDEACAAFDLFAPASRAWATA